MLVRALRRSAAKHTTQITQAQQTIAMSTVRSYPTEPRVGTHQETQIIFLFDCRSTVDHQPDLKIVNFHAGIGIVILRHLQLTSPPEVLLIRRGKPPQTGKWSFPGGSLELNETIIDCAMRETLEETGIKLRHNNANGALFPPDGDLQSPVAYAGVDVMSHDDDGKLAYHYAIIEVAAVPEDPHQVPRASGDAAAVQWFPVPEVRVMREAGDAVPKLDEVTEEAVRRFKITH